MVSRLQPGDIGKISVVTQKGDHGLDPWRVSHELPGTKPLVSQEPCTSLEAEALARELCKALCRPRA